MLDALTVMLQEGVVRSLTPAMQSKLVSDLLARAADPARSPLVRAYALRAAHAAAVVFNPVRGEVLRMGGGSGGEGGGSSGDDEEGAAAATAGAYVRAAVAALRLATETPGAAAANTPASSADSADGDAPAAAAAAALANPFSLDPFERLKLLSTACQALYLAAAGADAAAAIPFTAGAGARRLGDAQRLPDVSQLAAAGAGPLLARAVAAAAATLLDRAAAVAAAKKAGSPGQKAEKKLKDGDDDDEDGEDGLADKALAGELTYEDNWAEYLKANFDSPDVAEAAAAVVGFGGALLQLLARSKDGNGANGDEHAWPGDAALAQLASAAVGEGSAQQGAAVRAVAEALQSGPGEAAPAVVGLPLFAALAAATFGRRCCQCGAREEAGAPLKRCGACARAYYCTERCQKAAWAGGHKTACKQMAATKG